MDKLEKYIDVLRVLARQSDDPDAQLLQNIPMLIPSESKGIFNKLFGRKAA
jgi:hypothetical protein